MFYNLYTMNIIERNYISKLTLRETQNSIQIIDKKLLSKLDDLIEFVLVKQPVVSSKRIVANTSNSTNGNRQINFDSSNDSNVYYIYNDYRYWLVQTLNKLEIKNNNAVATFVNYIDRDTEIKNTQSLEKRKLLIEYRYDNKEKVYEKAQEINTMVYDIIKYVNKEVIINYPILRNNVLPDVLDVKELKKISSRHNREESLADVASDEGAFLLVDKRNPKTDRTISNTFEISMYAYSKQINEAYQIYKIQDRRTMEDIEPFTAESDAVMEEYIFGKEALKGNDIRSINIEIDLDALALMLLEKSHILEVQSGSTIDEVEKILSDSEVKHL